MFEIEKVLERDIDLYIINRFINDVKFKDLFLKPIKCTDYNVSKCIHSYSDEDGESDITIILDNKKEKIGLLIEDKISAIAMPNQYSRYKLRGDKLVSDGTFNKYYIFIVAPADYLSSNIEAQKYDYKISYENILEQIKGDIYGESLIKEAIKEKKKGYSVIENKPVTQFWNKYYNLVENKYPMLSIKRHDTSRGSNACWPIFITPIRGIMIYHKSNKGYVDLTFPGLADKYFEVYAVVKNELDDNTTLQTTSKSLAIRINVPKLNFKGDFDEQIEQVNECLDAIFKLHNLTGKINCEKIMQISKSEYFKTF